MTMAAKTKQQVDAERQARQMTQQWAENAAQQGFFGGIHVVTQTQDGVFTANPKYIGDRALAEKIVEGPPKVITQPLPWWRRVLKFFLAEKTK